MTVTADQRRFWSFRVVLAVCIVLPAVMVWQDVQHSGEGWLKLEDMLPQRVHEVEVRMALRSPDVRGFVRTYLPTRDMRQDILEESILSGGPMGRVEWDTHGRKATWENVAEDVRYRFVVRTDAVSYDLSEWTPMEGAVAAPGMRVHLESTGSIHDREPLCHRRRQPEGRRRQNHIRRQPRSLPRGIRAANASHRYGPAGQRQQRLWHRQRGTPDLRRTD